jgi:hypothetical protein
MPGLLNDTQLNINKAGLITTGMGGFSDGSGNPTYPYAHNDVTQFVPASLLIGDTLPVLTYDTGDIPKRTLVNATHKVVVPFFGIVRSTTIGGVPAGASPISAAHGFLLKSYKLFYQVNTSDLTSITGTLLTAPFAAGAGLPTVVTETVTVSGGTLTQAANVYALTVTVTTPVWKTVDDTGIWGVVTIVVPTNTCDVLGASWQLAMALS